MFPKREQGMQLITDSHGFARIFSLVILSAFLVILSESKESLFALEIENLKSKI